MSITLCSLFLLCIYSGGSCTVGGRISFHRSGIQYGRDLIQLLMLLFTPCISVNLLYLAGPKLKGMCGEAVSNLEKINPTPLLSYLGEEMMKPDPSLPLNKNSAVVPQLGPGTGLHLLFIVCFSWLITVLAFLCLVKKDTKSSVCPGPALCLKLFSFSHI